MSFDDFLFEELRIAYLEARKGKRRTMDEHRFELNEGRNLIALKNDILRQTYKPSRGVAFVIRDPVIREIVAAPFRDRIVHHFLFRTCAGWWDRRFSPDSYSCRKGKGTLYGQKRLAHHLQAASDNFTQPAFVAKLDIQGYFMSLKHEKLYERVLWGLEQQFFCSSLPDEKNDIRCAPKDRQRLYHLLIFLWRQIIFDRPMKNVAVRGPKSDWVKLPKNKSLFCQPPGQGIVIGNLTSQLLSNIYLDCLDRFVTFDLGYKHYGRYVDDFFIVAPEEKKQQLLRDIAVIEKFLKDNLDLTLHPKKRYFQNINRGTPFIGTVVYPHHIVVGRRAKKRFRKAVHLLVTRGKGDVEGLVARMGCYEHVESRAFFNKVLTEYGWEHLKVQN